jgi:hypothetical protein
MPGGHANHKGTSDKPNVNAPGVMVKRLTKQQSQKIYCQKKQQRTLHIEQKKL